MPFAGTYNNPYFADRQEMFARWNDGTPIVSRWSGTLLDMSHPKTQAFVRERVKRIADWGYRYFKLDGMHTGAVTHNVYVNTDSGFLYLAIPDLNDGLGLTAVDLNADLAWHVRAWGKWVLDRARQALNEGSRAAKEAAE